MNIMLVSVRERTPEIDLRQAVGARTRNILMPFLVEAVTLSIAGGYIGVVLGIAASAMVSHFANWNTVASIASIALAILFSALVITLRERPLISIRLRLSAPNNYREGFQMAAIFASDSG